jgi:hypothetical protein
VQDGGKNLPFDSICVDGTLDRVPSQEVFGNAANEKIVVQCCDTAQAQLAGQDAAPYADQYCRRYPGYPGAQQNCFSWQGGNAATASTHEAAKAICEAASLDLCPNPTRCKNTGCDQNKNVVWTSTPCPV